MPEDIFKIESPKRIKVEKLLNKVSYKYNKKYVPSLFALNFVNFIKLVNDGKGEENKTPIMHYKMLDTIIQSDKDTINMCHRGSCKTTLLGTYLFLYLAVYGALPNFGQVPYALYVADSMENGVKKMRKDLECRWENSKFLQEWIPKIKFTDNRWEFINKDGVHFVVTGHGANTGVRGTREVRTRPVLAILDDLLSDDDARSPTIISSIEDTVYGAVDFALHTQRRKIIWSGTPFNAKDPLYKAVESGAWNVNIFPACEEFPCSRDNFRASWPDRISYDYVHTQYEKALALGKIRMFNQELMLRIMSAEDRLITNSDISWYKRDLLLQNKSNFNYYITTDFATSDRQSADYSVISVWGYSAQGQWFWVDGICKKQLMNKNIDDLFRLAQIYSPMEVGIEISGQQGGFISWIKDQMIMRNVFFNLAKETNTKKEGIRPKTNKLQRFNIVVPWFKSHQIFFPKELKEEITMVECINELELVSVSGIKSKHDDFLDTISMLAELTVWKPSGAIPLVQDAKTGIWDSDDIEPEYNSLNSYIV